MTREQTQCRSVLGEHALCISDAWMLLSGRQLVLQAAPLRLQMGPALWLLFGSDGMDVPCYQGLVIICRCSCCVRDSGSGCLVMYQVAACHVSDLRENLL